jgi:transposase
MIAPKARPRGAESQYGHGRGDMGGRFCGPRCRSREELERLRDRAERDNKRIAELERLVEEQQKQIADREKQINDREKQINERDKQINERDKQIADLERKLALRRRNSTNSSKPPSSDGLAKPGPEPDKKKRKQRRPGGQKGHPGHSRPLAPPEQVNEFKDHYPEHCAGCQQALPTDPNSRVTVGEPWRVQVIELPEIKPIIDEHRMHSLQCACGKVTRAPLPVEAKNTFGPRLTATMAHLSMLGHIPRRAMMRVLDQVLGIPISLGSVQNSLEEVSAAVAAPCKELEQALPEQSRLNCDETGSRTNKQRRWIWVFVAATFAFFTIEVTRGTEVLERLLGKRFAGILGNDRMGSYLKYLNIQVREGIGVLMQFCWAHFKRDLLGALAVARCEAGKQFCQKALDCEKRLFRLWHRFRKQTSVRGSPPLTRQQLIDKAQPIAKELFVLAEHHLDSDDPEVRNLASALFEHNDKFFTFIHHEGVEPTNNVSERTLRPSVQRRKITFGNRSREGELAVARLSTVYATARIQKRNPLPYLTEALRAYRAGKPAPSLLHPAA